MTTRIARRLPRERGRAGWNAILGPRAPRPALKEAVTADLAIVGGGFAGLSAARRFLQLQPGARVVLLEAGEIAEGTAGRNSGFMIDLPHDLASADYAGAGDESRRIALNRQAIAFARDAVAEFQIPPAYFDEIGKVNGAGGAAAEAHNDSYAAHLAALGEANERLDAKAMEDLTGSRFYRSGLYTPGTVQLQPAGYIRGLAEGLAATIALYENTPAKAIARTGPDWRIDTPEGSVTAAKVILATNGHIESFGFAAGRLMHLFLYASMTPELDAETCRTLGGTPRWGVTPSDPMGTTVRRLDTPLGGNRIVTRTAATLRSGMAASAADVARATRAQRRKFDARFPALKGLKPEYEWAGQLCLTLNGVAVTGELEPGLFSAAVQNGLGTARGTLTGIAAAEMAAGTETDITRHFAAEPEPRRLPPRPVRDLGANALLRWRELRAGAE
ncbi:MAG: FAD-binding oxidoreductase [Paracoccaceae bacterium]|nr:FAD-binding oxidoreductase [Paracoccaceae bacterium]